MWQYWALVRHGKIKFKEAFTHIALDIPDAIAGAIACGKDLAQVALEAMALEGYRSQRLSEYDVRELLGFTTPMQVHGFLKEHGVYLHYSMEDLEHDIRESDRILEAVEARGSPSERPKG